MIKVCQFCKKEFKTSDAKRKFCSRKCFIQSLGTAKCIVCGKDFIKKATRSCFCSKTCFGKLKSRYETAKKNGYTGIMNDLESLELFFKQKKEEEELEGGVELIQVMRKCHDCGAETVNYRCDACWIKYREKYGINDNIDDIEDL